MLNPEILILLTEEKDNMLLNCHTYYSYRYGTFSIENLLEEVQRNGYNSFVLSDINNTSACLNTIRIAKNRGNLNVIAGIDFRNGARQQYVGIARNNEGFKELNEYLSLHLHASLAFDEIAPEFANAYIIYPLSLYKGWNLKPNEFIGVSIRDLKYFHLSPFRPEMSKIVVLNQVSFATSKHFNAHRLLRAIDTNSMLSRLPVSEQATGAEIMLPREELYRIYASYPEIIYNTEQILNTCSIDFVYDKLANSNLKSFHESIEDDIFTLKQKCDEGLIYRYPNASKEVKARVEKELDIIGKLGFASYFLINHDIINYARFKNYYYVGRGSGANSIVAYLLRITDVDPIELDLYFERFINMERSNAPDFDIDFSWTDRDDITQYIFKHERFNRANNVALLGSYNTFKSDSIIRELGKVFGFAPSEIDQLQQQKKETHKDKISKLILNYSDFLNGYPSHLSIHASGIIISEKPITCYSATSLPPKGYPTTQFSMLEAEDIGLYKFDILSQRGLAKIKDALQIIKTNKGAEIDIHDIPRFTADPEVKELLRKGNTIGCFYVESPAMRMLLAKLQADDYLRLVAASSIIRPGVAKSGMMREYIIRFREESHRKRARDKSPELYELMKETYGVMVYQEDVIKVAHQFADLTLAESDHLRRGMSWKFKERDEFFKVKEKFFSNCIQKGHPYQLTNEVWTQIESFANFAFSKGHSASYAVESYQALFLKAHFPLEYMVATLNNGGGFYRTELYIHEARMKGAKIVLPCINNSDALCTIQGESIYLGLKMIGELEENCIRQIIEERTDTGAFKDMYEFIKRVPLSIEQMRLLIRAGTFDFTKRSKKELLWEVHTLIRPIKTKHLRNELFESVPKTFNLPSLVDSKLDEAFEQIELLGFSLDSPFNLLRKHEETTMTARQLINHIGKKVKILGYLVNIKHTLAADSKKMYFGTFIDRDGYWIDTVHFPPSAHQYPFIGNGCYLLTGKVTMEYDFVSIEVEEMKRIPMIDRESADAESSLLAADNSLQSD
jgi:DNA polymerase-3 subunit alpha